VCVCVSVRAGHAASRVEPDRLREVNELA
jgi:hypothetical protein